MRYQSKRPKRQFLAAAACPNCQKTDVIVHVQLFEPAFDEYIECIECHHQERRPTAEQIADISSPSDDGVGVVRFR